MAEPITAAALEADPARTLAPWLAGTPVAARLGGDPGTWQAANLSDGNMNWVYRLSGAEGSVCVKWAADYIRVIGPGWSAPAARLLFEAEALQRYAAAVPGSVPDILHIDRGQNLIVLAFLDGYRVLRDILTGKAEEGLKPEAIPAGVGARLGRHLAGAHVATSPHARPSPAFRADLALFAGNAGLAEATEEVIFRDCFMETDRVRYERPALDGWVRHFRTSGEVGAAVARLKTRFMTGAEVLLHGDLHTGSVMIGPALPGHASPDCRMIDHEFAMMGPPAFDLGMFLANLWIAIATVPALDPESTGQERRARIGSLLEAATTFMAAYGETYLQARTGAKAVDSLWPEPVYRGHARASLRRDRIEADLEAIRSECLGFAALEMIRRSIGLSHVQDWTRIADDEARVTAKEPVLRLADDLLRTGASGLTVALAGEQIAAAVLARI